MIKLKLLSTGKIKNTKKTIYTINVLKSKMRTKKIKDNRSEKQRLRDFAVFAIKEKRISLVNGIEVNKATTIAIFIKYKELFGIEVKEGYIKYRKERGSKFGSKPIKDKLEDGFVYFVVNEKQAICKIGYSVSPAKRLKELQTGCPYPLHVQKTVVGDIEMERLFHKIYNEYRLEGEWFKLQGELKTFVYPNR